MQTFVFLIGTRPEAIKLFPVIHRMKSAGNAKVFICLTAQHRQMLDQVLKYAELKADVDLNLMVPNQTLTQLSSSMLTAIGDVLDKVRPDRVIVQGDTTTAMIGAMAAFYRQIPVAHVEAGLRSGDIGAPWPEEGNRKFIDVVADKLFAPTEYAAAALKKENVSDARIFVTGNTVVDALLYAADRLDKNPDAATNWRQELGASDEKCRIILVTTHRRESFGAGMEHIADSLLQIAEREDVMIALPLHPNPNVKNILIARLSNHPRIRLIPAQEYMNFVALLRACYFVLTDSGGIQEEAPTFGKPVLIMRDNTERPEAVHAGTSKLVGTEATRIVSEAFKLLDDPDHHLSMSKAHNPYGDGHASERIVKELLYA